MNGNSLFHTSSMFTMLGARHRRHNYLPMEHLPFHQIVCTSLVLCSNTQKRLDVMSWWTYRRRTLLFLLKIHILVILWRMNLTGIDSIFCNILQIQNTNTTATTTDDDDDDDDDKWLQRSPLNLTSLCFLEPDVKTLVTIILRTEWTVGESIYNFLH